MKKVNYMSEKEFNNLRLAIYKKTGPTISTSRNNVNKDGTIIYYFENKEEKND